MSPRAIAAQLLGASGVSSFAPQPTGFTANTRGIVQNDLSNLGLCLSAAAQELYEISPSTLSERDDGGFLNGPQTISINVTAQSTAICIPATGGTFNLSDPLVQETSMPGFAYNITAAALQEGMVSQLDASIFGSATVTGPQGGPFVITIQGFGILQAGSSLTNGGLVSVVGNQAQVSVGNDSTPSYNSPSSAAGTVFTVSLYQPMPFVANGCTIRISGDGFDNELIDPATLARPYNGPTANGVTAVVFGDAILLDPQIKNIMAPIRVQRYPLYLCGDLAEFELFPNIEGIRPMVTMSNGYQVGYGQDVYAGDYDQQKQTGYPRVAYIDTRYQPSQTNLSVYLRVSPMPLKSLPIRFRKKLKPPIFTAADIDDGTGNAPVYSRIFPMDLTESILAPVAMRRWTMDNSCILSDKQVAEIARQYDMALNIVRGMRPQIGHTTARYE